MIFWTWIGGRTSIQRRFIFINFGSSAKAHRIMQSIKARDVFHILMLELSLLHRPDSDLMHHQLYIYTYIL